MSDTNRSVIIAGGRTPVGRLMGSLSSQTASDLGGLAIAAALQRAGLPGDEVQYTIMGQVLTAGAGQLPARQAACAGGIPMRTPAMTINNVCLSGLDAIALADKFIRAGHSDIIVAGGQESMSQAPHLLGNSRAGFKYGDATMRDHLAHDGLRDVFTDQAMGALTESTSTVSREDQDAFALASHLRAGSARNRGLFDDEIVPVSVRAGRGRTDLVSIDEGVRFDASADTMSRLSPAFSPTGTITAGNASMMGDGAAAVVVMRKSRARELGLEWIAEIGAHSSVAGPDSTLQLQPANAIAEACGTDGIDPARLDLVEINEAFAAVGVESTRALGLSDERVNVNGGAISIGHPLAMSGTRIALHLALELRRRGGGVGAAALCGGGGQGTALLLRVA